VKNKYIQAKPGKESISDLLGGMDQENRG